jgi:hypothetical protein
MLIELTNTAASPSMAQEEKMNELLKMVREFTEGISFDSEFKIHSDASVSMRINRLEKALEVDDDRRKVFITFLLSSSGEEHFSECNITLAGSGR